MGTNQTRMKRGVAGLQSTSLTASPFVFYSCRFVDNFLGGPMAVRLLAALLTLLPAARLFAADLPADSAYVRAVGDHLELDGRRVRYWGFIGFVAGGGAHFGPGDAADVRREKLAKRRADIDLMVKRIGDLGFNLVRSWEGTFDLGPTNLAMFIKDQNYEVGDGSEADTTAYYFAQLDKAGKKIWMSSTNSLGAVAPGDAGAMNDPATAEAWKAAVAELAAREGGALKIRSDPGNLIIYFDPRVEKIAINRYGRFADWRNKYKTDVDPAGLRLGDDPQIAVWELTNEQIPLRSLFNGQWQTLPPFFKNELLAKWHGYLKRKYGTDEKLKAAWQFLLPGESLDKQTVLLAPLAEPVGPAAALNDANPVVVKSLEMAQQQYSRIDFARARGADVVEFFTDLVIGHKKRFADAIKQFGKSCRLSPCVWDSGNMYQIQSTYMFQQADATSACTYVKGMGYDPTDRRYPFWSSLDSFPRLCWDVPWVEQSTAADKPTFLYETNIDNRTKYRAEFPLRIAAAGAIQGWDIVCWHVYGNTRDSAKQRPFESPINDWHDYFGYGGDEVQLSAMRAAAEVFKHGLLDPAPTPTTLVFGRHSLFDPESMDYGKSYGDLGRRIIPTMYRYGVRLRIDPAVEGDSVEGPSIRNGVYEPNPVRPTPQISFDWHKSELTFDAPAVAGYVGFLAQHGGPAVEFPTSGVAFRDVTVVNPPGMPYPVADDEKYVEITLASADDKPLAACGRAVLSAVSTSFNSGYKLDLTTGTKGRQQDGPADGPPAEFWGAYLAEGGGLPVLVARVGVTVSAPAINGMDYVFYDFEMKPIGTGTVSDGTLTVPADRAVFYVELRRGKSTNRHE